MFTEFNESLQGQISWKSAAYSSILWRIRVAPLIIDIIIIDTVSLSLSLSNTNFSLSRFLENSIVNTFYHGSNSLVVMQRSRLLFVVG
jgi:hypothetical protein